MIQKPYRYAVRNTQKKITSKWKAVLHALVASYDGRGTRDVTCIE